MDKLRKASKRLSVGSWAPFSDGEKRVSSRSPSTASIKRSGDFTDGSERAAPSAAPAAAKGEANGKTNGAANTSATTSMVELAKIISINSEKLEKYMKENGIAMPSFGIEGPANFPSLPEDIKKAREEVVRATKELEYLATGPTEKIRWMAWDFNDQLSLRTVYSYQIAKSFPVNETATFAQISEKVGLDEVNLRRLLRHAMANHIFREVSPGVVAHTAASKVLAEDPAINDWIGFCLEDIWVAACQTIPALKLNPAANEPTQTGFCLANNTTDVEPMFVTMGKSPMRAKRFGGAMVSLTGGVGYELSYLLDNYDWASLNAVSGTVVDIGGSHGFVCTALAEKHPNLKFVVQDLPKTVSSAPALPEALAGRVEYQAHDFFTPQPVKGADVYFFRWILHNQADKYAIKMLKQLIPALKKGAKVVINDHCLREPGEETAWDEKIMRSMDLVMLTLLNAQERSEAEFRELFAKVDDRFKFLGVTRPKGCRMSIVEATWLGEDYDGEENGAEADGN